MAHAQVAHRCLTIGATASSRSALEMTVDGAALRTYPHLETVSTRMRTARAAAKLA